VFGILEEIMDSLVGITTV